MDKDEPPSSSAKTTTPFLVGRNSRGQWVVRDQSGLRGGIFIDRTHALKFAMFESDSRPQAVIMVPDGLELDMRRQPHTAHRPLGTPLS
jgi:hypothetical protein